MRRAPLDVPPLELPEATLRVEHWQRCLGRPHNGGWIRVEPRDGSPPWELPIYTVHYHPDLEEDVQDIFILRLEARPLAIIDEAGRKFGLCLQSRSLNPAEPDPWIALFDQLGPEEVSEFCQALHLLEPAPPDIPDPFATSHLEDTFGLFNRLPPPRKRLFWQICFTDLAESRWPARASMLWGGDFFESLDESDYSYEEQRDRLQQSLMKYLVRHPELEGQQLQTHHQQLRHEFGLPVHPPELYQRAADFVAAHDRQAVEWPFPEDHRPDPAPALPTLDNPLEVAHGYLRRLGLPFSLAGPEGEYWRGICAHYLQPLLFRGLYSSDDGSGE